MTWLLKITAETIEKKAEVYFGFDKKVLDPLNLQSLLPNFVIIDTAGEHDNHRARDLCAAVQARTRNRSGLFIWQCGM